MRRSKPRGDVIYAPLLPSRHVARVERVAKAVADEIDRYHREEDEEAREDRDPRRLPHVRGRVVQHVAPRRRGRLYPQPEERERALGDDRGADAERPRDDDGRDRVRQDMAEDDPPIARADAARRLDEFTLLQ